MTETSDMWRAFVVLTNPQGWRSVADFRACPGETAEEAIDYALQVLGTPPPGYEAVSASAARESAFSEEIPLELAAAYKRRERS